MSDKWVTPEQVKAMNEWLDGQPDESIVAVLKPVRTREEAARFADGQFAYKRETQRGKANRHHYGLQDLRDLLDFLYGGPPANEAECLRGPSWVVRRCKEREGTK